MSFRTTPSRLAFLLVLVLAFLLRVFRSDTYGLYLDEKYTMVVSQGIVMEGANQRDVFFTPGKTYFTPQEFWAPKTFADFIEANIRNDIGNSPVYYGALWLWIKVFGMSDFSVRLLSVLFSTLVVGLIYLFVRRHFRSETLALLSALLAAVEPFFIAYSHMARNYSMSFFLTLLATHLFLLILEREKVRRSSRALYAAYGLTFVLSVLSHYLTVTVFLCHGLYFLFFVRQAKLWLRFAAVALVGIGLVSLWFVFGGGKYTFQTLQYQADLYRNVARTNPYNNGFGLILPATPANLAERSAPLWADLFIVSNGLGQVRALGFRNLLLATALGLAAAVLLHLALRRNEKASRLAWAFPLLLLAGLPFYTLAQTSLLVVSALPSFAYLTARYIRAHFGRADRPLLVFMLMLAFIPTLFLILMSLRNGHTYGITQRYSGFSFPYTVLLVAMLLREIVRTPVVLRAALLAVLAVQGYRVAGRLWAVYEDREPKYTYFVNPRGTNPHALSARRILKAYAPGDTIIYPAIRLAPTDEIEKTYWPYSIQDAQLTNLYLPKDATFYQRMDTTQSDRIYLVKGRTGQKITIFDFKGRKYRY
ncbi:glycosyltransferase family 39 protein [Tellurirhabdus rosea]|uniref:glycosyltransferase family 39 protein n=1 Tax=Tellurirhabdus rosea TaxID=2674997 RepID=UPI002256A842|nr:glycosyltransferase family 39 protein [Tellurirhabdus rosea]